MTKQERVTFVINTLKELYPTIPVPLDHKDPYTLLMAVLLSAMHRCACKPDYAFTFAKADNPYDMVKMTVEEIKQIIVRVDYHLKSKGIHGLSHILLDKHDGKTSEF
jgi:endonuclease-3